jgi:DNA processing protein
LDEVARATGLGVRDVRVALLELSLAGRVEQHGGQLVSARPSADD